MKLIPLEDRVVVKRIEEKEKKIGNIIIPDTAKEKPLIAEVIAVGSDEDLKKNLKKGDKVLFAKYGGTEIEVDGAELIILRKEDIYAKVE